MNLTSSYTMQEIEAFVDAYQQDQENNQSKSLKKLLSVHDKIHIFKNIKPIYLKALVYDLHFVKAKFKDFIVKENDESDFIYFLIDGECQVFINNKKVGALLAGMVFGESGVIFESKRNASVICASEHATFLAFRIDQENNEFNSFALATLYKNLASQINDKLEASNQR